jgi:hypothetical protein
LKFIQSLGKFNDFFRGHLANDFLGFLVDNLDHADTTLVVDRETDVAGGRLDETLDLLDGVGEGLLIRLLALIRLLLAARTVSLLRAQNGGPLVDCRRRRTAIGSQNSSYGGIFRELAFATSAR